MLLLLVLLLCKDEAGEDGVRCANRTIPYVPLPKMPGTKDKLATRVVFPSASNSSLTGGTPALVAELQDETDAVPSMVTAGDCGGVFIPRLSSPSSFFLAAEAAADEEEDIVVLVVIVVAVVIVVDDGFATRHVVVAISCFNKAVCSSCC